MAKPNPVATVRTVLLADGTRVSLTPSDKRPGELIAVVGLHVHTLTPSDADAWARALTQTAADARAIAARTGK